MMKVIWYWYNEDIQKWIKLRWNEEQSALSDVFTFTDDYKDMKIPYFHKKGTNLIMDYGVLGKLIDNETILTEEQYLNKKK